MASDGSPGAPHAQDAQRPEEGAEWSVSFKLCQRLRRHPPTLADATDAEIHHFQRLPTPTDATESLPKQVCYGTGTACYSCSCSVRFVKTPQVGGASAKGGRIPRRNAARCPIVVRTVVLRDALSAPALGAYRQDPDIHESPVTARDSSTNPAYEFLPIHGVRVR